MPNITANDDMHSYGALLSVDRNNAYAVVASLVCLR